MENKEIIEELKSLIQLDIDATRAYSQAINEISIKFIRDSLDEFRNDHERHIYNLSPIITELGGTPPEKTPDLKGFLISGFTMIRSQPGNMGALHAMESNEKLTNKQYSDACNKDFPKHIIDQLRLNYQDEQKHLEFIQHQLRILSENPRFYEQARPVTKPESRP
jgi:uncharacterized protein (TIGR02284 family)